MDKKERDEQIRAAYQNVFSHVEAGLVLKDLCHVVGFFDVMFLGDRREFLSPEEAAQKDGMRRVFLRILKFSGREKAMLETLEKTYGLAGRSSGGSEE